ncbi:universal stress protein [Staphylococcus sp. NAM3COL9]|uniref:universal stress protein n=1 Tax=Staphylococcus sp. NAM3COL9 TaxID=1667172 RepID=UPI00070D7173|nr:universal stress protein [Staphylococcus sp. NAM3COL9]KRG10818.1 universal stress protein [Staphylococcus sp. NAM3COL9]
MFKNILLPYSFENDFSNIPETLKNLMGKESVVTIYNVITQNDLLASVRYDNKHKSDITKEKEQELSPFLEELSNLSINYKVEIDFGPVKDTILEKISSGTLENGQFDLIVMSNHRTSLNIKHVLGDVTHKVTKRSPVPVLVVK